MDYTYIYPHICDVLSSNRRAPDRRAITASLHRPMFNNNALVTGAARRSALELHEQMAHVGTHPMTMMFPGLSTKDLTNVSACTACLTAKMTRRPYWSIPTVWKATRPAEIISVDDLNSSAETVGGGKYLLALIDQFTSFLEF